MENRVNILLVESDAYCVSDFKEEIAKSELFELLKVTESVKEALAFIPEALPDVVITELVHKQGDGVVFVGKVRRFDLEKHPYIIAMGHHTSNRVMQMLRDHVDVIFSKENIDFGAKMVLEHLAFMLPYLDPGKPTSQRFTDLTPPAVITSTMERRHKLRVYIEQHIMSKLYMGADMLGRKYLIDALILGVEHEGSELKHTKDIYPQLVKMHKNKADNINRAIDLALGNAWAKTDADTLGEIYTAYIKPTRGQPTPSEFIKYFVRYLRLKGFGNK